MGELKALLVEDSAVHQRLLAEAFKASGIPVRIEACSDADAAWTAIDRMRFQAFMDWPDFAIIDIGLPGMSGIELLDRIRQLRHFDDWPVVILTASQDPEDRTESMLARATGYFTKPTGAGGYRALAEDILRFLGYQREGAAGAPAAGTKKKAAPRPKASSGTTADY